MKCLPFCAAVVISNLAAVSCCTAIDALPPAADRKIDFHKDVVPILFNSCVKCHGGGKQKGDLSLDTRASLLKGGESGPAVVEGKSAESRLIKLVSGQDPDLIMPAQGPRLTAAQIGVLRAWIDQGLAWEEGFTFKKAQPAPVEPRRPKLPAAVAGSKSTHPIDLLLEPYLTAQKIQPGDVVDDRTFLRRAKLDLVGLLPNAEELSAFVNDAKPDKRQRLADSLLAQKQQYAEHWLTFWNDALRNAYRGTGFIDGGRTQISGWLYQSLYDNKPYDKFVHELIKPVPGSEGFIGGIVWRGVVNASQRREMQAAQNIGQVFMGTNLKCASCHDSFVNQWKLADSYALAAVFADAPLELHRCDKATGVIAEVKFIYPELGSIDAKAAKSERMQRLADIVASPQNGRLARTMVNRLWAWFFGRGLVEPVDDLDQPSWNADLLDWLAADFQDHAYDLQRTMRLICTSRAYQLGSVGAPRLDETDFIFRGPLVRRMTAEQFADAASTMTGVWASQPILASAQQPATKDPRFLKFDSDIMRSGVKQVDVDIRGAKVLRLEVLDAADGGSYDWADWGEPRFEGPGGVQKLTELKWKSATNGHGNVQINQNTVNKPLRIDGREVPYGLGVHANSAIVYEVPDGVERFKATIGPDTGSVEQKGTKISVRFLVSIGDQPSPTGYRAALVNEDALTRALGRPNREQVVTRRDSIATTLQALELTNGATLDGMLKQGAARLLAQKLSSQDLITTVYAQALGRAPIDSEASAALELVGSPAKTEGVEDLLWSLMMSPEFQLIY